MATHDRYEMDILKQLTRIANSLDAINRKFSNESSGMVIRAKEDNPIKMGDPTKEG